ncbi:lactate utilization protein C [Alkalilimnicola sp. S0819]|nr:lactate utilization protein C [Alkalilimnicola sp. S0819]MPQ17627.1 lactate utilization protein C [Alkalilimnicola sp. S0819]
MQRLHAALDGNRPDLAQTLAERERLLAGTAPRPQWSEDTEARFLDRLSAAAASHEFVESREALASRAIAFLGDLPVRKLRIAPHELLRGLDWPADWEVKQGVGGETDWPAAITVAEAGVAETGTLVLPSGPETPSSLNFLPDYHLVVLRQGSILPYLEDVWPRLREKALPRMVNLITGPSRTADVEQTIQLGAHGPRSLHVLILRES